jgi:TP901 family phage tail tape measure protein
MPGGRVEVEVVPDLREFPSKLGSGLRSAGGVATAAGRGLGLAVAAGTVAAAVGLKSIITLGNEYTANMNELQAVTGATGITMSRVGDLAKQLGSDITLPGTSAADAAAAMKELAKGGLSVDEAMTAAKGTLQLAAAAQIEAAQAAEIQSDALNQFGLAAGEAGRVADILANTANAASGEVTDIANALKYVGPVAKTVGADIDSVATAIGLIATQGIRGEQAGTSLRGMIASLASPSGPAAEALKTLAINAFTAEGKFVGLRSITEQLAAAKGRLTEAEFTTAAAVAFGNEGMTVASALASTGAQAFDDMGVAIGRAGGAAEVAAAKTQGLGGAWDGLVSQAETTGIEIYEAIDGPLEGMVRSATGHLESLGDGIVKGLEAAVAAGEVYGPRLADAIRSRASVLKDAANDVLAPLAGGGLAIGNEGINVALRAWDQLTDVLDDVVDGARPAAEGIRDLALSAVDGDGAVSALAAGIGLLGDGLAAATDVLGPVGSLIGGVASAAASLPGPLQAAVLGLIAYRVASSALGNSDALPGIRQFSGEMRVQAALAAASGQSIGRLDAALAAYHTTQLGGVVALRSFTDVMGDLRREAESAGRPIGVTTAAIGALAERSPAVAAMASAYQRTFDVISTGSERAALGAGIAAESLGRLGSSTAGVSKVAQEVQAAGDKVGGFGASVRSTFDSAREAVASRASAIASSVTAIPTAVGVAAINVSDRMRGMVSSIGDAVTSLPGRLALIPTAVGVGVIDTFNRVPGAVTGAVNALGQFGAVAGGVAAAGARGLVSAAGSLVGALGGPWGIAIAAAGVGLSLLASHQQDAAKRTAEHSSRVDGLVAALRESNGQINEAVRARQAQDIQNTKVADSERSVADAARASGISLTQLTDATLGNGRALDGLREKLQAVADANKEFATLEDGSQAWTGRYNEQGQAALDLLGSIDGLAKGFQDAQQEERDLDQAIREGRASMLDATDAGRGFSAAMAVLGSSTASADDKARALKDALDALAGGALNLEAAQSRVNGQVDRLNSLFGDGVDKAKGWGTEVNNAGVALVDASGKINTTTENGRSLLETLNDMSAGAAEVATRTFEMARANGDDVPVAMQKAAASVQATRDALLAQHDAWGLTGAELDTVLNRYGLVPEEIATLISQPGMDKAQLELLLLKAKTDAVPGLKEIRVQSLSQEAQRLLEAVGFTVERIKDSKEVVIRANDGDFNARINQATAPATKVITLAYRDPGAPTGPRLGGPNLVNHDGNYVIKGYASGGLAGLKPMAAGIAAVVPPNTWRVVGDRMVDNEAYIPINKSLRSQQILTQAANEMGYDVIRRYAVGGIARTGGGSSQPSFPTEFRLTGGVFELVGDGLVRLVDGRITTALDSAGSAITRRRRI